MESSRELSTAWMAAVLGESFRITKYQQAVITTWLLVSRSTQNTMPFFSLEPAGRKDRRYT